MLKVLFKSEICVVFVWFASVRIGLFIFQIVNAAILSAVRFLTVSNTSGKKLLPNISSNSALSFASVSGDTGFIPVKWEKGLICSMVNHPRLAVLIHNFWWICLQKRKQTLIFDSRNSIFLVGKPRIYGVNTFKEAVFSISVSAWS